MVFIIEKTRLSLFSSFISIQDLDTYSSSYSGLARLNRLLYIADHCPSLQLEALRMALAYVMTTCNTNMYQQIHRKFQDAVAS